MLTRVTFFGTLSETLDFEKFRRQIDRVLNNTRPRSSLLTTVTTVDAVYFTPVDAVYTLCNFDFSWICCATRS